MMLAFHNTIKSRDQAIADARAHQEDDRFVQGCYWDKKKKRGCSVGCMVNEYLGAEPHSTADWHKAEGVLYGIPESLSCLRDCVFESLPMDHAAREEFWQKSADKIIELVSQAKIVNEMDKS